MAQKASKAESMMLAPIRLRAGNRLLSKCTLERCCPSLFACVLLAFVHLLLELLGLLLTHKR